MLLFLTQYADEEMKKIVKRMKSGSTIRDLSLPRHALGYENRAFNPIIKRAAWMMHISASAVKIRS